MSRMTSEELSQELHARAWSLDDACEAIFLRTRAIVKAKNVRKSLEGGALSWTATAAFRLLFNTSREASHG